MAAKKKASRGTKAFVDVFSPATYQRFSKTAKTVSGFRERHRKASERVEPGDKLLCYLTKLSRWVGVLEVESGPYDDEQPLFVEKDDPYVIRFRVKPLVWLPPEHGVPAQDDVLWKKLSFTKDLPRGSALWTGKVRTSLAPIDHEDAEVLLAELEKQTKHPKVYRLDDKERRILTPHEVRREDGPVPVTVPDDAHDESSAGVGDVRESIRVQARLCELGAAMGMRIWLPRSDRGRVLEVWKPAGGVLLEELPLNYDNTTLQTIENIDVIWMKQRAIVRAFEVEHTTAIYSGILRMADLLALQPNMDIQLHIVAPSTRRDRVFEQLRRPVFSLLERRPLWKTCTFLSYESLEELAALPHLQHLSDSIVDEYVDEAEEVG